jgi:uncharacterized protein GlcG (DUF336 family)
MAATGRVSEAAVEVTDARTVISAAMSAAVVDGEVIGAIGVSFDTPEHDLKIAQAGLTAVPH